MTTSKTCEFWQHNRKPQQIFAVVTQVGSLPVAYGPLALDEITTCSNTA